MSGWFRPIGEDDYCWDCADLRRMQRTDADREALYRRLARQRVRFILWRLIRRC